ncbi:MAG: hypothetical protein M1482_10400 [Chloroflexi bacterium]|nr:hypothetical protein [Chloroflexota bacterium]
METRPEKLDDLKQLNLAAAGYVPLPIQEQIHRASERVLLISGGEGSGKSLVTAAEIVSRLLTWQLVYLVGPQYAQAHKEIDYCYEMLARMEAATPAGFSRPRAGKATLTTRAGWRIETLSSEEGPKAVTGTGESPDILAMVEAGKQSYEIFLACRARVARSRGLLILSGTIEQSQRWYPELVNRWQADNPEGGRSFIIPTWANTALYPGGEADPEILALKATYPPDRFLERFGAVPCPPGDAVIKEFSFVDHVDERVEFDPAQSVELWIDPGYSGSHYAVEVVQFPSPRDVNVIDEIYADHSITQEIIDAARLKPWWNAVPKKADRRSAGVIDIAAKAHAAMPSVWQTWDAAGISLGMKSVEVEEGVAVHRAMLKPPAGGPPRLMFNPCCKGAFSEYASWKRRSVGDALLEPDTRNCDAMKALHYGLVDRFGVLGQEHIEAHAAPLAENAYDAEAFTIR